MRTRLINEVMSSKATSVWLLKALETSMERDMVDAINDAEVLVACLKDRWETAVRRAKEGKPTSLTLNEAASLPKEEGRDKTTEKARTWLKDGGW